MERLFFPSLRGMIGDWIYYPCLMNLKDIAAYVRVAEEIYQNKGLSQLLQRTLRHARGKDIKKYLLTQEQRFFNSLVIAVYGGEPNWTRLEKLESDPLSEYSIPDEVVENIGVLVFNGQEKLFALDGQHRLVGIREAIKTNPQLGSEQIPVIFVSHGTDKKGIERSRRLFTTLNKNAKPVSKGEIIALDEDDTMAVTLRRLVVEHPMFVDKRIAFKTTTNLSTNDYTSLTTIANLYDILSILFIRIVGDGRPADVKKSLTTLRLNDDLLNDYYQKACTYFELLADHFDAIKEFKNAENYSDIIKKYRTSDGGNVLFRPIGLSIVTELLAMLSKSKSLKESFELIAKIPRNLTEEPYANVIWQTGTKRINSKGKTLARRLLAYMLRINDDSIDKAKLLKDYANFLDKEPSEVKLPQKLRV